MQRENNKYIKIFFIKFRYKGELIFKKAHLIDVFTHLFVILFLVHLIVYNFVVI